jgi:hypothetical protein
MSVLLNQSLIVNEVEIGEQESELTTDAVAIRNFKIANSN